MAISSNFAKTCSNVIFFLLAHAFEYSGDVRVCHGVLGACKLPNTTTGNDSLPSVRLCNYAQDTAAAASLTVGMAISGTAIPACAGGEFFTVVFFAGAGAFVGFAAAFFLTGAFLATSLAEAVFFAALMSARLFFCAAAMRFRIAGPNLRLAVFLAGRAAFFAAFAEDVFPAFCFAHRLR